MTTDFLSLQSVTTDFLPHYTETTDFLPLQSVKTDFLPHHNVTTDYHCKNRIVLDSVKSVQTINNGGLSDTFPTELEGTVRDSAKTRRGEQQGQTVSCLADNKGRLSAV